MSDHEQSESPATNRGKKPGRRSQVAWMLTSGVLQSAVAFGSNLVLVRYLAPADFGSFALTLASIGLLFGLLHLRTGLLVIRDEAERFDQDRKQLLWSTCVLETVLLSAAATGWLALVGKLTLWAGVLIAATALQHLSNNGRSFVERDEAYHRLAPIEGIAHLLAHAGAACMAITGAGVAALYLRELFLAVCLGVALWFLGALRPAKLRFVRPAELAAIAREAKDLILDGALESTYARAQVLFAGMVGGPVGAGLYFQAHRLAVVPHQILQPVAGRLAFNWLSRAKDADERRRVRNRILSRLAIPLGLAAAGTLFLAGPVIPWLFGPRWAPAAPVLQALVGVVLGSSVFAVYKMQMLAEGRGASLLMSRTLHLGALAIGASFAFWSSDPIRFLALWTSVGHGAAIACALWIFRKQRPSGSAGPQSSNRALDQRTAA